MRHKFLNFINTHQLCSLADKLLVACSGGKDSMALVHLFQSCGYDIAVAHCNFQLRGEESDADEAFVKDYCKKHNLVFFSIKFDTKAYVKVKRVSTQMAARILRYDWFDELMVKNGFRYLATAHHLNDALETLILNIAKGTGPNGLKSIPIKAKARIRPLLYATQTEILDYLKQHALVWREDASNASQDYQRNVVRHQVVPVLKTINPGLEQTVFANLERFAGLSAIFEEKLGQFVDAVVHYSEVGIYINYKICRNWPGFALLLEEFLKPFGFNFSQVQTILSLSQVGKRVSSEGFTLEHGRENWFVFKRYSNLMATESPLFYFENSGVFDCGLWQIFIEISYEMPSPEALKQSQSAYFDYEKISWPLCYRPWQIGDRMHPFGMKGTKLISDMLIDKKIEVNLKRNQMVVSDSKHILWLVGQRSSDLHRVSPHTGKVLKLSVIKK
jgi:tRNA(Ile)-lysidine synthase